MCREDQGETGRENPSPIPSSPGFRSPIPALEGKGGGPGDTTASLSATHLDQDRKSPSRWPPYVFHGLLGLPARRQHQPGVEPHSPETPPRSTTVNSKPGPPIPSPSRSTQVAANRNSLDGAEPRSRGALWASSIPGAHKGGQSQDDGIRSWKSRIPPRRVQDASDTLGTVGSSALRWLRGVPGRDRTTWKSCVNRERKAPAQQSR